MNARRTFVWAPLLLLAGLGCKESVASQQLSVCITAYAEQAIVADDIRLAEPRQECDQGRASRRDQSGLFMLTRTVAENWWDGFAERLGQGRVCIRRTTGKWQTVALRYGENPRNIHVSCERAGPGREDECFVAMGREALAVREQCPCRRPPFAGSPLSSWCR